MPQQSDVLVQWATWAFSPAISAIIVAVLISILLPILTHWRLYRKAESATLPTLLLVGPSGGGKTTLLTLFSGGTILPTQTSQEPQTARCRLADSICSSGDQYRSENDTSARAQPAFILIDTPGHGKLRHHANEILDNSTSALKGLLFVLDSAAISSRSGLTEAAEYLHDVMLVLQKRHTMNKTSRGPQPVPILVLANKQDVFTSLPASIVQKKLEEEMTKIRSTRSRGLLDSGIGMDDGQGTEEEQHWLGEYGSKQFSFSQMEEHGVEVTVLGGNAKGENGRVGNVQAWWDWIGQCV